VYRSETAELSVTQMTKLSSDCLERNYNKIC